MQQVNQRAIRGMAAAVLMALAPTMYARGNPLSPALAPLGFLVGNWQGEQGHAEGNTQVRGSSRIEPAAGGAALLRQDHTQVFAASGALLQTFDQVMLVYPESGQLHADYFDGTHAIHYQKADLEPGRFVRFITESAPGRPTFRLTYKLFDTERLSVSFEMAPPGQSVFTVVAAGTARRVH